MCVILTVDFHVHIHSTLVDTEPSYSPCNPFLSIYFSSLLSFVYFIFSIQLLLSCPLPVFSYSFLTFLFLISLVFYFCFSSTSNFFTSLSFLPSGLLPFFPFHILFLHYHHHRLPLSFHLIFFLPSSSSSSFESPSFLSVYSFLSLPSE